MKVKSLLLILTLVLVMSLLSTSVFAANPDEIVSINPAGFLVGTFTLNYEKVMDNTKSYLVGGAYYSYGVGDWDISGLGVNASMKFYKEENAPEGFYYGPVGQVLFINSQYGDTTGDSSVLASIGGNAGFQWLLKDGFTVDLNAGVSLSMGDITVGDQSAPVTGISPTIGINLGYAF